MQPSDTPPQPLNPSVFRGVFDAYPDAVLLVDMQGEIVLANAAAAQLLGYSISQLVGLGVDALVPPGVTARHQGLRRGYAHAPRARPMGGDLELTARRADGSEVMVEIGLSPMQSGGARFVVAALRGIGAYPRVRRALQRARYNEYIARAGRAAVDLRDAQQLIACVAALGAQALEVETLVVWLLEANRLEFCAASAYAAAGSAALPTLLDAPVPNRADTLLGYVTAHGTALLVSSFARENRFNVTPAQRQGPIQCALAVPMLDSGRAIGVLVASSAKAGRFGDDETSFLGSLANLIVTGQQRAQTEAQLGHAQRLEAVGQLTGGIAHDFNNLLTIMQGNLQMLADHPDVAGNTPLSQMVGAASRAGQRGAELTGKLLAFSRRQTLAAGPVDTGALLAALAELLRRTLGERIRVALQVHPACPLCVADAAQLESALLNIALNSRDAMPDGGTLSFSCAPCSELPDQMRLVPGPAGQGTPGAAKPGEWVAITVADTGVGMSPEVIDRAFEPFFTTKEAGKGTGLGLSTVYGFVKQSGGHVQLLSRPGAGTSIVLFLPAVAASTDAPHAAGLPAPQASATLRGARALIVEDDSGVRDVAIRFLTDLGAQVQAYADAETALRELQRGEPFDLLFSDIMLGAGMNGTELAQAAHAIAPRLAVLLTSGYAQDLAGAKAAAPLPWPVLKKPYTRDGLAAAAHRALAAVPLTPTLSRPPKAPASG